jgi:hypothetical protein
VSVLTIYNCGTNFHRNSGDTVALLHADTMRDAAFINDGVGSGSLLPNRFGGRANPGGATKVGGLLFGHGLDANVRAALEVVQARQPTQINMCGWSRGGVTCTKISAALSRNPATSHIPVFIFAIDPVPGSVGPAGNHAWRHIELTPNVRAYSVVFAQHDNRGGFAPTYPNLAGNTNVTVEIMPGSHSAVAMARQPYAEAGELVFDMAKRFLLAHRTPLISRTLLTATQLIEKYARVQIDFLEYRKMASPDPGWLRRQFGATQPATRTMKDDRGSVIGAMRPDQVGFFVNEHHRDLFQAKYFYLTQELDRDVATAFRQGTAGTGWVRDATRLATEEPCAFEQLGYHIDRLLRSH